MDDWNPSQKLLRDGLTRTGKRAALALKMDGTKRNGGVTSDTTPTTRTRKGGVPVVLNYFWGEGGNVLCLVPFLLLVRSTRLHRQGAAVQCSAAQRSAARNRTATCYYHK